MTYLALKSYPVGLSFGVQQVRAGDVLDSAKFSDEDFTSLIDGAPFAGVSPFPLSGTLSAAADQAVVDRLRAVPDDIIETNLLSAATV